LINFRSSSSKVNEPHIQIPDESMIYQNFRINLLLDWIGLLENK